MITEEQVTKLKRLIDDRKDFEKKLDQVNHFVPADGIKVKFKYRTYNNYQDLAEIYCNYDEIIDLLKEKFSSKINQLNEKINSLQLVEINNTLEI
jgi:hypothetical protein